MTRYRGRSLSPLRGLRLFGPSIPTVGNGGLFSVVPAGLGAFRCDPKDEECSRSLSFDEQLKPYLQHQHQQAREDEIMKHGPPHPQTIPTLLSPNLLSP